MMARLGDVCAKITDGSHNPPQGISCSAYLMLSSKNIYDDDISFDDPRYLSKENYETENKRTQISAGDILLTIVGTVGRAAVVSKTEKKICLQRSVAVIKPKQELIDSRFLMYQLQSMRTHLEQEARGVAQKGIYLRQVENLQIKVPSRGEQLQVVSNLDQISELISLRKQQLAKLDELVKSRFIELFGSVEVNVFGFETIKIKDACDLINGKAFKPEDWSETGLPIVRIQNLNNDQAPFNFFNGEIKEQYLIDTGELLFSWSGTPGTSFGAFFWNRGKAVLNQHIFRVKPKIEFNLSFLQFALNGRIDHIISKAHGGVGLQHITKKELDEVELLLPAIELQNQFTAFVEQTDKSKLAIQESLAELETLKKALMQKYFG